MDGKMNRFLLLSPTICVTILNPVRSSFQMRSPVLIEVESSMQMVP
jgi:hypothetical protein